MLEYPAFPRGSLASRNLGLSPSWNFPKIQGAPRFAIITWNNPKNGRNPASPTNNTCQSLGLILSCNKVLLVDPGLLCHLFMHGHMKCMGRKIHGFTKYGHPCHEVTCRDALAVNMPPVAYAPKAYFSHSQSQFYPTSYTTTPSDWNHPGHHLMDWFLFQWFITELLWALRFLRIPEGWSYDPSNHSPIPERIPTLQMLGDSCGIQWILENHVIVKTAKKTPKYRKFLTMCQSNQIQSNPTHVWLIIIKMR